MQEPKSSAHEVRSSGIVAVPPAASASKARLACLRVPYGRDVMNWDEEFSERYDAWASGVVDDIPFYVELAREADGPVVELAVGTGRVAIPVAQAIGRRVIGLDASPEMLRQARAHAAEAGVDLLLIEGDMRDLSLEEPAGLIYCPFRALLHLRTWADRRQTFERVAASLRPGGRFAWNAFAFDHRVAISLDGVRHESTSPGWGSRGSTAGSRASRSPTRAPSTYSWRGAEVFRGASPPHPGHTRATALVGAYRTNAPGGSGGGGARSVWQARLA